MTDFIQSKEGSQYVSSLLHAVFRLEEDGKLRWVATLDDMVRAERLMETLDWQWPGDYVIHHVLVDVQQNCAVPRELC